MTDFEQLELKTKDFIEARFPLILKEMGLEPIDSVINDFLDLDKYVKPRQLFIDFNQYIFEHLSNESKDEEIKFNVYLVFRNTKASELRTKMLKYATAFYLLFEKTGCNFDGLYDMGKIETVSFYNAAEGNSNIKIAELSISMRIET